MKSKATIMFTFLLLASAAVALLMFASSDFAAEPPPPSTQHKHTNRLIDETSPYLLQHAHNPVDWHPWGPEAFDKARRENKPVFLSVGYSTCHWCHVMEHESFEDEAVAEILNEHFVPIKVDREERPDVDEQYMMATQLFTRRGGWPNSVWLTPDGRPWFAGTYFPKEDRAGMAGFKTVLRELAGAWKDRREDVEKQAESFAAAIREAGAAVGQGERPLEPGVVDRAIAYFTQNYDEQRGGFGSAPKFPPHGALAMMLHRQLAGGEARDLQVAGVVGHTLEAMAAGGIYDHLAGGFHRYSTDARWFLPHFEKMLYDNAQLISAHADGYQLLRDENLRRVVAETFGWLEREMTDPAGGFYSAIDADSEGEEGKFYVWTIKELEDVLGEQDAGLVVKVYGATEDGNFVEEATRHRTGGNVLHLHQPLSESAKQLGMDEPALRTKLDGLRGKLLAARNKRIRPHLDDKVLSGWNGLMIDALAKAGRVFGEERYTAAAKRAADFVLANMQRDGVLLRSWRKGEAKLPGYLDDYAYLAAGLLKLHATTGEKRWLDEAKRLANRMIELFHDDKAGGFYNTSEAHETLLLRAKELGGGGNVPSGNGVAAQVLIRLALLTGDEQYGRIAADTLNHFSGMMWSSPHGNEALVLAAAMYFDDGAKLPPLRPAQPQTDADAIAGNPPVIVEAYTEQTTVRPGQVLNIALRIRIGEGYHIYGPKLAQPNLIATAVTLSGGPAKLGDARYPDPKQATDPVLGEPIAMYHGTVTLLAPVTLNDDAPLGDAELVLTVRAQACDDRSCLAPETYTLKLPLTISRDAPAGEARHKDLFQNIK